MTTVVISPHLDDAALSLGEWIAGQPPDTVTVVSVMAGIPPGDLPLTKFDVDSGFTSAREAVTKRRAEDVRALTVLDAQHVHLDVLDRQYGTDATVEDVKDALFAYLQTIDFETLAFPLGLVHADHRVVSQAVRLLTRTYRAGDVVVYEDLPSRVLWPDTVPPTIREFADDGFKLYPMSLQYVERAKYRAVKRAAVECYRSQRWALEEVDPCIFAPERTYLLEAQ